MKIPIPNSRKAWSFLVFLFFLLALAIVGAVAIAVWAVDWQFFATLGGFGSSGEIAHQTAQATAERSPNYNPGPAFAASPPSQASSVGPVPADYTTMVPRKPPRKIDGPLVS